MWASNYPGISSMARIMALAFTMAAAVLFQPILDGTPRQIAAPKASDRLQQPCSDPEKRPQPLSSGNAGFALV
jgi:hypothetical protein